MFEESPKDFINNSSIGIHAVSPDGIVIYANPYELETLGYQKDEYVGHHVSEFQLDKDCLNEIMEKLGRLESLSNYPAKVKAKSGVKYIIYNSSVYEEEGTFVHTRCFGTEVNKEVYDAFYNFYLSEKTR